MVGFGCLPFRAIRLAAIALLIGLFGSAAAIAEVAWPSDIPAYDPDDYSQEVTECDRLAGHKEDPYKVVPGRSSSEIEDLDAAIAACHEAVAADPDNPRLNYQLGRVYGYSGRGEEAMPYRLKAVEKGYPQALFVIGYISVFGANIEQDVCKGGELIRASALAGRFAGRVGFPHYALEGRFDGCDNVQIDWSEMLDILDKARAQAKTYYQELLVEGLMDQVAYRAAQAKRPEEF